LGLSLIAQAPVNVPVPVPERQRARRMADRVGRILITSVWMFTEIRQ